MDGSKTYDNYIDAFLAGGSEEAVLTRFFLDGLDDSFKKNTARTSSTVPAGRSSASSTIPTHCTSLTSLMKIPAGSSLS